MANAKLKLGNAPKTFTKVVEVPLLDGAVADVLMTFKYRTRTEFGALMDFIINKVNEPENPKKGKAVSEEEAAKTLSEMFAAGNASNVEYVLMIAEAWDLEDEFGEKALAELANEYPGAINAISEAYREAISEGRVKN